MLHLTETPLCWTLMSLFVFAAIFKRTGEAFSQPASKGESVLPFPLFHDERKEWGRYLSQKICLKYSNFAVQMLYYKLKFPQHFVLAIISIVENCTNRNIPIYLNLRYFIQCILPFCCLQPSARFFFPLFFRRCFERNIP